MCINTYSLVKRVCVGHASYILSVKAEGSTRLVYTGLIGGLEHLKIETRLIDEKIVNTLGECVTVIRKDAALARIFPTRHRSIDEKAVRR